MTAQPPDDHKDRILRILDILKRTPPDSNPETADSEQSPLEDDPFAQLPPKKKQPWYK